MSRTRVPTIFVAVAAALSLAAVLPGGAADAQTARTYNCTGNDTSGLRSAVSAGGDLTVNGQCRITRGTEPPSGTTVTLSPGTKIAFVGDRRNITGDGGGVRAGIFLINGRTNVTVQGGTLADETTWNGSGPSTEGVRVFNGSGIRVQNQTQTGFSLDGTYLNGPSSTTVHNVAVSSMGRNAVSLIAGQNVTISSLRASNWRSGITALGAAVAIEPNQGENRPLTGIRLNNIQSDRMQIGLWIDTSRRPAGSSALDIVVNGATVRGSVSSWSNAVIGRSSNQGGAVVLNDVNTTTSGIGLLVRNWHSSASALRVNRFHVEYGSSTTTRAMDIFSNSSLDPTSASIGNIYVDRATKNPARAGSSGLLGLGIIGGSSPVVDVTIRRHDSTNLCRSIRFTNTNYLVDDRCRGTVQ